MIGFELEEIILDDVEVHWNIKNIESQNNCIIKAFALFRRYSTVVIR
jgi:hypothetical protein